jgi:hypothetical protein
MTDFGAIPTEIAAAMVLDNGYDEVTSPVGTTSATLEDITGLSFTVTIPTGRTGRIVAHMAVQTSTTGGSPSTGGWAISINSVDGTEIQRYLSGSNDTGALVVQSRQTALSAGTYTVKGRHRRVVGASTVNSDVTILSAVAYLE